MSDDGEVRARLRALMPIKRLRKEGRCEAPSAEARRTLQGEETKLTKSVGFLSISLSVRGTPRPMDGLLNMVRSIKRGANVGTTTGVRHTLRSLSLRSFR